MKPVDVADRLTMRPRTIWWKRLEAKLFALLPYRRKQAINFEALVESSMDVTLQIVVGPAFVLPLYVSPSVLPVFGYTQSEFIAARMTPYTAESQQKVRENLARLLREEAKCGTVELEATRKDGSTIWLESRVQVVAGQTGERRSAVVCMRDITERKLMERQLADLVLVDALTGVGNRRAFDATIADAIERTIQQCVPLSLVMVDVDHFKKVNDTFGHPVGDACLRAIANATERLMKTPEAFVARYGGEELAVLLPGLSIEDAADLAQKLCQAVSRIMVPAFTSGTEPWNLTVSCGVSTANEQGAEANREPAALVKAADAALYAAKRGGRNRVVKQSLSFDAGACLPLAVV